MKYPLKKVPFGILILIVLIIGVFVYTEVTKVDYTPTEYEKELINYFNEVALKTEHYDAPEKIIKWVEPMTLFVFKDSTNDRQMKAIEKTINTINELATDGFKIVLNDDIVKCNAFIYLCNKEKVAELNPRFYRMFNEGINYEVSGYANIRYDWKKNIIIKVYIYIDEEDPINVQESTILEEITQSLGLANDPTTHPNSIFFENKSEESNIMNEYSKIDRDVLRLLYHPKMRPGLNFKQAEKVIKRILRSEKK